MADFFIIKARTKYTGKVSENDRFMAGIIRTNYGLRIVPKPEAKEFLKSLYGVGGLILVAMMWVAYVVTKAYKDAEDTCEKAIHFCDENNLQTSELWTIQIRK